MRNQKDIDQFTLAFHRRAVAQLRQDRQLLGRACATLDRWQAQRGPTASDPYFDEWRVLLSRGPDAIEQRVCVDGDSAAALRSVSPLGFVLSVGERMDLHRRVKAGNAA